MKIKQNKNGKQLVAFAYARYSSNNQREESIDAQLRSIREYCKRNNVILLESFYDEAKTGQNDNRDEFQRMINGVIKGHYEIDAILVHKFSRFARSMFDSVLHKKRLKDIGVRVISVTQNIDDTPEGALLERFLEAMDEYYSRNLALEVQKGLRENALKGKHAGGNVPFGFALDKDGKYIPNKDAAIVKRIFEEYAAEVPKTEICARLNAEGLRNQRGNTFNVRTVYDMLRNEKYIGNYIYTIGKNEVIRLDGIITPIISRDLWARVQNFCNQPVKARLRHQKTKYLLTGKTFCEICGAQICGAGSKKMRNGDYVYYYKCVGKTKHKNGCNNPSLNKTWYEANVLKTVINTVLSDDQIKYIAKMTFEELTAMQGAPAVTTSALQQEYTKLIAKQKRITGLYLEGEYDKEMLDDLNKPLKQRKFEIENELEKRKAVEHADSITEEMIYDYVIQYIDNIKANGKTDNEEFMRSVFTTFIDRVVVNDKAINVLVNADFSRFELVGDNKKLAGVIHRLTPVKIQASFLRKLNMWARNEHYEL